MTTDINLKLNFNVIFINNDGCLDRLISEKEERVQYNNDLIDSMVQTIFSDFCKKVQQRDDSFAEIAHLKTDSTSYPDAKRRYVTVNLCAIGKCSQGGILFKQIVTDSLLIESASVSSSPTKSELPQGIGN